jgi:hypothetical protein
MKILAEDITAKELLPGDLFSTATQFYWDHRMIGSIGEKVYIRTDVPCPEDQLDVEICRITISQEE